MSWSNDAVLEFLELYRREQVLWDPKHPLHRNRGEVTDAWLRIQSSLSINCSIVDLKKKKESLMTSFRMHFNKKKRSDEGYHTTWFAYPVMASFLGGKYECDSTNQMDNEYFNSASYSCSTQTALPDSIKSSNAERNNACRQYKAINPPPPQTDHKQEPDFAHAKKEVIEAVSYLKNLADEKRETDECDLYGQLLAKKLRKLDERQRDVVMHEIDNIMFRAKMQGGSALTRSYSPSPPSPPVQRKVKSPIFMVAPQTRMQFDNENVSYDDHLQPQAPS